MQIIISIKLKYIRCITCFNFCTTWYGCVQEVHISSTILHSPTFKKKPKSNERRTILVLQETTSQLAPAYAVPIPKFCNPLLSLIELFLNCNIHRNTSQLGGYFRPNSFRNPVVAMPVVYPETPPIMLCFRDPMISAAWSITRQVIKVQHLIH